MSGLMRIDTDGNVNVAGNAYFAKNVQVSGELQANLISPLQKNDLMVRLAEASHSSGFAIADASGSAKFRVNSLGEVIASGSARFLSLMAKDLNLVRGAQADTSVTQTVASSSAGTATINKGQRERTIVSPYVSESSLIYLTPTSDTHGLTPYIARQTKEDAEEGTLGSFTIQVSSTALQDISLNWWIIN